MFHPFQSNGGSNKKKKKKKKGGSNNCQDVQMQELSMDKNKELTGLDDKKSNDGKEKSLWRYFSFFSYGDPQNENKQSNVNRKRKQNQEASEENAIEMVKLNKKITWDEEQLEQELSQLLLNDKQELEKNYGKLLNIFNSKQELPKEQVTDFIKISGNILFISANSNEKLNPETLLNFCSDCVGLVANNSSKQDREEFCEEFFSYLKSIKIIDIFEQAGLNQYFPVIFQGTTAEYEKTSQEIFNENDDFEGFLGYAVNSSQREFLNYFVNKIDKLSDKRQGYHWACILLGICINFGSPKVFREQLYKLMQITNTSANQFAFDLADPMEDMLLDTDANNEHSENNHLIIKLVAMVFRNQRLAMLRCLLVNTAFTLGKIVLATHPNPDRYKNLWLEKANESNVDEKYWLAVNYFYCIGATKDKKIHEILIESYKTIPDYARMVNVTGHGKMEKLLYWLEYKLLHIKNTKNSDEWMKLSTEEQNALAKAYDDYKSKLKYIRSLLDLPMLELPYNIGVSVKLSW